MTGEMGFEFYSEVKLLKSYFGTNCAVIVAEGGENKGRNFCNMTDEDCSPSANYFCSVVLHPSSYPSIHPFPSLPLFPFNPAYLLDIGRTQARARATILSIGLAATSLICLSLTASPSVRVRQLHGE